MEYQCFFVEERVTPNGKKLKKLTLQAKGKQYPIKGVTMWGNHPLFGSISPGQTVDLEIEETDSGNPNPNAPGKNYINRTVKGPNPSPNALQSPQTNDSPRNTNLIEFKVLPLLDRILARQGLIMKALDLKVDEGGYPQMNQKNDSHGLEDMMSEDTPF